MDHWSGQTVVVTGGLGFIGSHFVEQLLDRDANVVCLYRAERPEVLAELPGTGRLRLVQMDLTDYRELGALFKYVAPRLHTVVHCAALNGNLEFKINNAAEIMDTNVRMTSNILSWARAYDTKDVVLLSSAEIYSAPPTYPVREEDDHQRHLEFSSNGYRMSKTYAEVLAELHRRQFGMNIFMPRPVNVYGPRDNFHDATKPVIPSILTRAAAGEEIEIWGDGSQTRSFVHVSDLVRVVLRMVEVNKHQTLNISTTDSVSIVELVRLVSQALDQPERYRLDPGKPSGAAARTLDLTRLHEIIDFEPRSFHQGLRETVQWYRRRQNAALPAESMPAGPMSAGPMSAGSMPAGSMSATGS
jgi:nucleoside-diphosphate-sugar epimerase